MMFPLEPQPAVAAIAANARTRKTVFDFTAMLLREKMQDE
jgi:hypothetical protein